jgi:hypothetical protein
MSRRKQCSMFARTSWIKGEIDGYIFECVGLVFSVVWCVVLDSCYLFDVVLLAMPAIKGGVNV